MGWYVAVAFGGFLLGFAAAAIFAAAKRGDGMTQDSVREWFATHPERDKVLYGMVASIYDRKRHISKNPPKGIKRKLKEVA